MLPSPTFPSFLSNVAFFLSFSGAYWTEKMSLHVISEAYFDDICLQAELRLYSLLPTEKVTWQRQMKLASWTMHVKLWASYKRNYNTQQHDLTIVTPSIAQEWCHLILICLMASSLLIQSIRRVNLNVRVMIHMWESIFVNTQQFIRFNHIGAVPVIVPNYSLFWVDLDPISWGCSVLAFFRCIVSVSWPTSRCFERLRWLFKSLAPNFYCLYHFAFLRLISKATTWMRIICKLCPIGNSKRCKCWTVDT